MTSSPPRIQNARRQNDEFGSSSSVRILGVLVLKAENHRLLTFEISFRSDIAYSCSADSAGSSSCLVRCRQSDYGQLLSACSLLLQTLVCLRTVNKCPNQTSFMVVLFCVFRGVFFRPTVVLAYGPSGSVEYPAFLVSLSEVLDSAPPSAGGLQRPRGKRQ
ncbi:hypothetical protein GOODEAATRI_033244 [Goodea atripinnis]|uniref:Uncharacterized protein n=1 Tax=Goodea atripinnis TaxID=208336 RepID=A0ABV0NZX4_9TELE